MPADTWQGDATGFSVDCPVCGTTLVATPDRYDPDAFPQIHRRLMAHLKLHGGFYASKDVRETVAAKLEYKRLSAPSGKAG